MNKIKTYIYFSLVAIIFMILSIWLIKIFNGEMPYVDQWTRSFVHTIAESQLYEFAYWVTKLGSQTFLIPFTIVMGIFLWWLYDDWFPSFIFSGGTLMSYLLNEMIKLIVVRERPSMNVDAHAIGYSFPSGHAMISMVCYGLFIYFLRKKLSSKKINDILLICFSSLIFLIGMSRYIINVHYLTDVFSGFTIGFLLFICFIYLYEWIEEHHRFNT